MPLMRDSAGLAERIQRDLDALDEPDESLAVLAETADEKRAEAWAMLSLPGWTEALVEERRTWSRDGVGFTVTFSRHRKTWRPDNAPFSIKRTSDGVCMGGNNSLAGAQRTALIMNGHAKVAFLITTTTVSLEDADDRVAALYAAADEETDP